MPGTTTPRLSLEQLLTFTEGALKGAAVEPDGGYLLAAPEVADSGSVAVVWTRDSLAAARDAGLLVVSDSLEHHAGDRPRVLVPDARSAFARIARELLPRRSGGQGIAATARVDPQASVHPTATLGDFVSIAAGASVGARSQIGPGSSLGERSSIGEDCLLHAGVHVYHDVEVGDRVILHSGVVLGADGFGFVATEAGPLKIEHLGGVSIGDDVEIGANSAVDRATLGTTSIGARSKLDNLVQVGHNVTIGSDCLIVGQSAIGGSTRIGDRVTLGGNAAIADHVVIEDDAVIGALSGVNKLVPQGEYWFGIPAVPHRSFARRQYLQGRLEEIWQHVREVRRK